MRTEKLAAAIDDATPAAPLFALQAHHPGSVVHFKSADHREAQMKPASLCCVAVICTLNACVLSACATAPKLDIGGQELLDLADASTGASWQWQPARFTSTGAVEPPTPHAFVALPTSELTSPRGGDGLSAVWYRVSFAAPPGTAGRPLLITISVDDYGEVVVGDHVLATSAGFNGVLVAELPPRPQHEVLILGVNSPLGRPPQWPLIRNEVFVRRPVRVIVDGASPVLERPRGGRALEPQQTCAMRIADGELHPLIDELDDTPCDESVAAGPRWLRYRVEGPTTLEVTGTGYAEVWVDGVLDLSFGENGRGPMSRIGGVQHVELSSGVHQIDVLAWPGPFSRPATAVDVLLARLD